jgi:hypothetical protein
MKITRIKCDQCGHEQDAGPINVRFGTRDVELPPKRMIHLDLGLGPVWHSMTATGARAETSFDFCSEACVGKFIEARSSILHNVERTHR